MSKHNDFSPNRVRIEQNTCMNEAAPFEVALPALAVAGGVEVPFTGIEVDMIGWKVGQVWSCR